MLKTGRYRHYKGHDYQVLDVALHSETEEPLVIYRALYGAGGLWARPLADFIASVQTAEGVVPRFRLLADDS